ncbi:hypothetical protein COOONC_07657 [Cooperia oncophora]
MEEPLQVSFKNTLIQRTCETFTVMNISPHLLPVVTSGIEALALHSASYLPQFLQLVHVFQVILPNPLLPKITFTEESDPRRASAQKFEPILEELYSVCVPTALRFATSDFQLCERMRDSQRLSSLMTSGQQVVARIQQRPVLSEEDRAVACCLLAAVSPYEDIANRFHVYLAALMSSPETLDASYEFLLRKAVDECTSSAA